MFSLLRRSARLLLEAGLAASVPVALTGVILCSGPASASNHRLVGAVHVSEGQARLEAMKVELAWLADPTSYQYPLKVAVAGDTLKATGIIPDEATRHRVLEVARQACYLPVVDGLVVQSARAEPATGDPTVRARTTLASHLRMNPNAFDISLQDGQLTLRGAVDSVERKVEASRCLRGLPGVRSIVNCLTVSSAINATPSIALVTANSALPAPGTVTQADHAEGAGVPDSTGSPDVGYSVPQARRGLIPVVLPPSPSKVVPSGLPVRQCVYIKMHGSQPELPTTQPVVYLVPTTGFASPPPMTMPGPTLLAPNYPGCASCGPIAVDHRMLHNKPRLIERLLPFLFIGRDTCVPPQYPGVYPHTAMTGAPVTTQPVLTPTPADGKESGGGQKEEENPEKKEGQTGARPELTQTWPPAHNVRPGGAPSRPLARFVPARQASSGPAQTVVPVAGRQPDVAQRIQPIPTSHAAPQPPVQAVQPASQSIAAHAWSGSAPVVVQTPAAPQLDVYRARPLDATQLRRHIQKNCGKLARDVRIQVAQDRSLLVHVYAAPAAEQHLVSKLLSMPELTTANVRLQVHLAP